MRTSELRGREDFEAILARTLQVGWSHWFEEPLQVGPADNGEGQLWCEHPLLSVICTPTPSAAVRRYIANGFRYTPVRWRAPMQWLLGTVLTTAPVMGRRGRPLLRATPGLAGGNHLLVLPGNQRVRCLDFSRRVCRVFLKEGFEPAAIQREATVRGPGKEGPFFTMTAVDPGGRWFEEPLVDGFCLARCPPWWSRRRLEAAVMTKLARWLERTARDDDAETYLAGLRAEIQAGLLELKARFGAAATAGVAAHVDRLSAAVSQMGRVRTAEGHGDLQPGNVLVAAEDGAVHLIDWEYTGRRSWPYDALVWCLGARSGVGLPARIHALLAGRIPPTLAPWLEAAPERSDRQRVIAWFLLEETARALDEATSGAYRTPPEGWGLLRATLDAIAPEVGER